MPRFNFASVYENNELSFSGSSLSMNGAITTNAIQVTNSIINEHNNLTDPYLVAIRQEKQNRLKKFIDEAITCVLQQDEYVSLRNEVLNKNQFENYNCTYIFGSSAMGIDTKSSDMDLAIDIPSLTNSYYIENKKLNKKLIRQFLSHLKAKIESMTQRSDNILFNNKTLKFELISYANIPIIKLTDSFNNIESDIAIHQKGVKIGTKMVRQYCQYNNDKRIKQLIIAIKTWSKKRGINGAMNGFISSYGYTILVIKFLQCVKPPILPIFQINDYNNQIYIATCDNNINDWNIDFNNNNFISRNGMTIGELMARFFHAMIFEFNVNEHAISLFNKGLMAKTKLLEIVKVKNVQQTFMVVQSANDKFGNVTKNVRKDTYCRIANECKRGLFLLRTFRGTNGNGDKNDNNYNDIWTKICDMNDKENVENMQTTWNLIHRQNMMPQLQNSKIEWDYQAPRQYPQQSNLLFNPISAPRLTFNANVNDESKQVIQDTIHDCVATINNAYENVNCILNYPCIMPTNNNNNLHQSKFARNYVRKNCQSHPITKYYID